MMYFGKEKSGPSISMPSSLDFLLLFSSEVSAAAAATSRRASIADRSKMKNENKLHEIVFPVLIPGLIVRGLHVLLGEQVVVRVVLLPLLLLALLGYPGLLLFLRPPIIIVISNFSLKTRMGNPGGRAEGGGRG